MKHINCTRRGFLHLAGLATGAAIAGCLTPAIANSEKRSNRKPNFIIFLTDDQGYNDVGCFGSPNIETPSFDRMAREGIMLTSYYVGSPVCGPSRAALMTSCYPIRVAEPQNRKNLHTIPHAQEIMLPEVLKQAGYATALIGKWHLAGGFRKHGNYPAELMPNGQGFDYFYGTPLHNGTTPTVTPKAFQVQIMRNDKILVDQIDQEGMDNLTGDYTQEAVRFITEHKDEPFFLYLAHNMPHVPLGASKAFRGKSKGGLYGDVIEELDWSMGKVLDALKDLDLDEDTFVVFTSDNGPWVEAYLKGYYGSAHPLRGSKMKSWEGGPRVPCIMRWPGHIPAGRTFELRGRSMGLNARHGMNYVSPAVPDSPFDQGFSIAVAGKARSIDSTGFSHITFDGRYPIGRVTYQDSDCPVKVELEAFSPFCPLKLNDSSLPAIVMSFTLTNHSR